MARADIITAVTGANALQYNGGGTHRPIQSSVDGTFWQFIIDSAADLMVTYSFDGGFTWTTPSSVFNGTIVAFACWYRRWSGIASDVVDIAYTEGVGHDIFYVSLDLATDTLGTPVTVFNGASVASGGGLSIVTGRNGHIRIIGNIDNGTEDGTWSSADNGASWADTIADATEGATQDQFYLLPGWNADTADVMMIFVDASTNGLSVKRYDDNLDTWTETAIIADGGLVDSAPGNSYPHVSVVCDVANSRNIVVAWSAVNTLNADLRCFIITDAAITEVTNVVLNSVNNQGLCAIGIDTDTGDWYVFYGGDPTGADTFPTSIGLNYKVSTDDGATWSAQNFLSTDTRSTSWLSCIPRFATDYIVTFIADQVNDIILASVEIPSGGGGGGNANLLAGKL